MNIDNYEVYNATLKVISPIHIGDGSEITKKEFVLSKQNNKILVLDIERLYGAFIQVGATATSEFENFLKAPEHSKQSVSLSSLLYKYKISHQEYVKYEIASTLDNLNEYNIKSCIKDAFGSPYIPGSSIKGMIRSALMAYTIATNSDLSEKIKKLINDELLKSPTKNSWKKLDKIISNEVDNMLKKREGIKPFSGLIIGDSEPISRNLLCLAQKIDLLLDGGENPLNVYKESIAPCSQVHFKLSIDKTKIANVDIDYIQNALDFSKTQINKYFFKEFSQEGLVSNFEKGLVFLGSAGFVTKTIIYQIFEEEAKSITWSILKSTMSKKMFEKHGRYRNIITPHTCKCAEFDDGSEEIAFDDVGQAILSFTKVS